jgi:hypothetical protein
MRYSFISYKTVHKAHSKWYTVFLLISNNSTAAFPKEVTPGFCEVFLQTGKTGCVNEYNMKAQGIRPGSQAPLKWKF